jgi:hypothetical protein
VEHILSIAPSGQVPSASVKDRRLRLKIVGVMEDPTVFSSFLFRACSVKAKNLDQIVLFGQVLYVNYTTRLV